MGTDQIIYCIVALLLGMLMYHMLKNVCGCKNVVEGQCVQPMMDLWDGDTEHELASWARMIVLAAAPGLGQGGGDCYGCVKECAGDQDYTKSDEYIASCILGRQSSSFGPRGLPVLHPGCGPPPRARGGGLAAAHAYESCKHEGKSTYDCAGFSGFAEELLKRVPHAQARHGKPAYIADNLPADSESPTAASTYGHISAETKLGDTRTAAEKAAALTSR